MKLPSEKQQKEFKKWGEAAPTHDEHGEDSFEHPISEKLVRARCWNWHMEGNVLHCDTDLGPLSQTMDSDVICLGEKDGLPILKKVVL